MNLVVALAVRRALCSLPTAAAVVASRPSRQDSLCVGFLIPAAVNPFLVPLLCVALFNNLCLSLVLFFLILNISGTRITRVVEMRTTVDGEHLFG